MKIIFPNPDGGISVIHPTGESAINEVALKDVPYNVPYLIADDSDLPADRTFRAAWEADFASAHGIGLGPQRWFIRQAEQELVEISERLTPEPPEEMRPRELLVSALEEISWDGEFEGWSDEQRQEWYVAYVADSQAIHAAHVAEVQAYNHAQAKRYERLVAGFELQREADASRCTALIAQMKDDVFAIEGVTL